ncbi:CPBP family intramembrane glutamic endopeptidase [Bacillus kwashiorkori]|uniref:CPBP family intramembrane glutamic endopeptidase n=1 Tax=Bacillus kwashiorkori TaxID=1522318 RepID=UPI00078222E5|nr:type II CAAX endopeptidase family protein [Bacillus kwashiorkori]
MKREYKLILLIYIAMQLSSPIIISLLALVYNNLNPSGDQFFQTTRVSWTVFSFFFTLLISVYLLRKERTAHNALPISTSIIWAITGIFLAFIAQSAGILTETLLGIEQGSENTQNILAVIESMPIFIVVVSIFGPILEEIVFRKIIFGTLYQRMNFLMAGLVSSLIFAIAHMEFEHIILYSFMGFTFAFLYVKTSRIIVPIFAHVTMNTLVIVVQLFLSDKLPEQASTIFSCLPF